MTPPCSEVSVDLKNGKFLIVVPRAVEGKQILQESGVSAAHRRLYKVESFLACPVRAQRFNLCALDQPVASRPRSFRETIAAFISSVLFLSMIWAGIQGHQVGHMAVRRLYAVGFRSQALPPLRNIDFREIASPGFSDIGFLKPSLICPSSPVRTGCSSACFSLHCSLRSASTPRSSAALIVFSKCCQINCWSQEAPFTTGPFPESRRARRHISAGIRSSTALCSRNSPPLSWEG